MQGVTEGRIVHFVIQTGEHRAAVIVNAWSKHQQYSEEGRVNLLVFLDGSNDVAVSAQNPRWFTSIKYSEGKEPGTWHWIEPA